MSVVALTGGIGTGKSTVRRLFAALGARTAGGDELAREVFDRPDVQQLLHEQLGLPLPVERQAVADLVFHDRAALTTLEAITHPRIRESFAAVRAALAPGEVLIYEYPLVPNPAEFDHVIVVDAPLDTRIERLLGRGMSREDVLARIANQAAAGDYAEVADLSLTNDGDETELARQVAALWEVISSGPTGIQHSAR